MGMSCSWMQHVVDLIDRQASAVGRGDGEVPPGSERSRKYPPGRCEQEDLPYASARGNAYLHLATLGWLAPDRVLSNLGRPSQTEGLHVRPTSEFAARARASNR